MNLPDVTTQNGPQPRRRLVVNADDFGGSESINQAVIRAHREGILTSASLMVNEPRAGEAVALARENPGLGVGLHLVLVCGAAALPAGAIPRLADARGQFSNRPVAAGWRYFASAQCRAQLRLEIAAQFEKFRATGLPLDHVNGHLHLHLHPVVFDILMENARRWGITALRLTDDWFGLSARLASGRWLYRLSHAAIYRILSARARRWRAGASATRALCLGCCRAGGWMRNTWPNCCRGCRRAIRSFTRIRRWINLRTNLTR